MAKERILTLKKQQRADMRRAFVSRLCHGSINEVSRLRPRGPARALPGSAARDGARQRRTRLFNRGEGRDAARQGKRENGEGEIFLHESYSVKERF